MRKKIIALVVAVCLFIGWGVRAYLVNKDSKEPIVQVYEKGQTAPIQNDYFETATESMDGYSVKIQSAELMTQGDFLKPYGKTTGFIKGGDGYPIDVYAVKILVKNESNPYVGEKGISIHHCMIQGTNYVIYPDDECFNLANPKMNGSTAFSLEKGKEIELVISYPIYTIQNPIEQIKSDTPKLVVSKYPHQKMLKLS